MADVNATSARPERPVMETIARATREVAIFVGLATWAFFWTQIARVHYAMGDSMAAAVTFALLVGPTVGYYLVRLSPATLHDLPTPDAPVGGSA